MNCGFSGIGENVAQTSLDRWYNVSGMGTVWEFRSVKPRYPQDRFHILGRFPIRRACPFIGTESHALAFARRACEHLKSNNVVRVEAWSSTGSDEPAPGAVTFRIRPHENG